MRAASAEFEIGRVAALSGDFPCASLHFSRALDAVAPRGHQPFADAYTKDYSRQLWDSMLRYEALAGPAEDAGNADGQLSPEVEAAIETAHPSEETLERARTAIVTDAGGAVNDVPMVLNDSVLRVLSVFQTDVKGVIERGLSRSGRYLPMIQRVFAEEGLPADLAYLPIIESSFLPHANSYASARGIWQFMPRTGRHYGLSSNAVVDERADPEKATRAAARYLSYLHDLFGDWYLALAAYNAGEGKILRAMQRTGARDFWELARTSTIRAQTKNYVPAYLAATLIAKNPLHYGFEVEYEAPLVYETVLLDRPVRITDLAAGDSVDIDELIKLNPELRTAVTPRQPEGYSLKVPPGQRTAVLLAYAAAPTAKLPTYKRHTVKKGQTMSSIARRYGVSTTSLAAANGLSTRARLQRGRVLLVPERDRVASASKKKGAAKPTKSGARASTPQTARAASPTRYKVRGGDTLYDIARRHGTTVERIQNANGLETTDIRAGQRLTIPVVSR
ncbi:MAG TPA: LysM peptidoglycan-binding domain-containing protein [Thermoanaerobaculia bacterium]